MKIDAWLIWIDWFYKALLGLETDIDPWAGVRRNGKGRSKWPRAKHRPLVAYSLRAPDGQIFRGMGILDFVTTHADLFDPADLKPYRAGGRKTCRASAYLANVNNRASNRFPAWNGWTLAPDE